MIAIVDCLAVGDVGTRMATLDVVGVGPRAIAGILERFNVPYELKLCHELLERVGLLSDYEALLISAMSSDLRSVLKLIRKYRRIRKDGLIIVGGPIFVNDEELIRGGADVVVRNEGELTLSELISQGLLEGRRDFLDCVKGITYRKGDEIIRNSARGFLSRHVLNRFKHSVNVVKCYKNFWALRIYVEVVRGCSNFFRPKPGLVNCIECHRCRAGPLSQRTECPVGIPPGCGYCGVPALFGPARSRDPYLVLSEIEGLVKLGVRRVVLSAPDFLDYGRDLLVEPEPLTNPREPPPNLDYIRKLLDLIIGLDEVRRGEVVISIENIKPNLVNEEVAELLGEYLSGTAVHIGLETGDEEHHVAVGRPSHVNEVLNAIKLLRKYGLRPYVYLIHGLPGQNERTIKNTLAVIDRLAKLGVEKITLYRFTPLKGTAFEKYPKPPPAIEDKLSKALYEKVREFNIRVKESMVGKVMEVIGVSRKGGYVVTYPIKHGPVVLVRGSSRLIGKLIKVKITEVLSDRELKGEVISYRTLMRI